MFRKSCYDAKNINFNGLGSEQISLKEGTSYFANRNCVVYDHQFQPVVMLAIKTKGCIPISIKYDRKKVQISQVDFAVVNYLDIEEVD